MKVQYVENLIAESGKSKTVLAKRLGISRANFYNKLKGSVSFKADEFIVLMDEVGVTSIEKIRDILEGND